MSAARPGTEKSLVPRVTKEGHVSRDFVPLFSECGNNMTTMIDAAVAAVAKITGVFSPEKESVSEREENNWRQDPNRSASTGTRGTTILIFFVVAILCTIEN